MAGTSEAPALTGEHFDSTQLIAQAKADQFAFLGIEKSVSQPPAALSSVLSRLRELGLKEVEGIYIPQATVNEGDSYPGQRMPIGEQYYQWYKAGQVSKASPELPGEWVVVETFRRPDYASIKKLKEGHGEEQDTYRPESDQMGAIIRDGRFEGKIKTRDEAGPIVPYLPQDSRFGVSINQQDDYVFPEFAKTIGIGGISLRRPTLAELNYLGNLSRLAHLGEATTLEAVQDVYLGIADRNAKGATGKWPERAIITGSSVRGGVSGIDYMLAKDQVDAVTFRTLVEFK